MSINNQWMKNYSIIQYPTGDNKKYIVYNSNKIIIFA
nr:MAG TPA: hypothetical protein [Caudoviricetes sp.]